MSSLYANEDYLCVASSVQSTSIVFITTNLSEYYTYELGGITTFGACAINDDCSYVIKEFGQQYFGFLKLFNTPQTPSDCFIGLSHNIMRAATGYNGMLSDFASSIRNGVDSALGM